MLIARKLLLIAAVSLSIPFSAGARETATTASAIPAPDPHIVNALRTSVPITIDGALVEPDWERAPRHDTFWQRNPDEGKPPSQKTEFQVLYDDDALYVAVRAYDDEPDRIRGLLTRRDGDSSSDWLLVGIDSYFDRRTAFVFSLNPAGVQRDFIVYDDTEDDDTWNAVWSGATGVTAEGWQAEFRIPYSQLRFSNATEHTWGLQVARVVQRTQEEIFWAPTPKSKPQLVSLFGTLEGVDNIPKNRRLELLPYGIAGGFFAPVDRDDPFQTGLEPELNAGLDFKYGVTSNFTVSGSINPDFGQVEADPSEVNLTAQETFFEEKRPLFLEGADIFRFGLGQGDGDNSVESLFYSRRIGAPPHVEPEYDYVRQDPVTTILGAAKFSGKTRDGWGIGVLEAVTGEEKADVQNVGEAPSEQVVEPPTSYTVARLQKDFNKGRTKLDFAYTGVYRRLEGTGIDTLHRQAYGGGIGLRHRFWKDEWLLNAKLVGSYVQGSPEAIAETQTSSRHYYQRPDAKHLKFDPTRTSLSGLGAVADVGRYGGEHWRGAVGLNTRTPGFEVNDLGFQRDADTIMNWLWTQYRDEKPGDTIRSYYVNTNWWTYSNWAEHVGYGGNVNGNVNLTNYWGAHAGFGLDNTLTYNGLLRGGPSVRGGLNVNTWGSVWTDTRKRLRLELNESYNAVPSNETWNNNVNLLTTVQAASNLELSAGPFVSRRIDDRQYVTEATDVNGDPRYILARIDQTTVGLTFRANYTLSPTLSLQFYAQPFASAGRYTGYKEPEDPKAHDYQARFHEFTDVELSEVDGVIQIDRDGDGAPEFAFDRADFNFREMRTNLIMRWEFRPGSQAFLIWSHSRNDDDTNGKFDLGPEFEGLRHGTGDNAVLLKVSYWWGA